MREIKSSKEVIKEIEADGWFFIKADGSHHHFKHPTKQGKAIKMATDALRGHLSCMEDDGDLIPAPSDFRAIHHERDEAVVIMEAWMVPLREKTVRKNLTIPSKLAEQADKAGINYSRLLTHALEEELRRSA